jgi:hypothetical protein
MMSTTPRFAACSNAIYDPRHALLPGHIRIRLPGQYPAEFPAEASREVDHRVLLRNLLLPLRSVGNGEVRRVAKHRHFEPFRPQCLLHLFQSGFIQRIDKTGIELQSIDIQCRGHLNPLKNGHGVIDAQSVHIALRKRSQFHHTVSSPLGIRDLCRLPELETNENQKGMRRT